MCFLLKFHNVIATVLCNSFASLCAKAECFARLCHRLGVRPSITLVSCIKTVQARVTKSLLWAAPRCLVYCDKISCHWVQGFSSNEGVKEGYPLKKDVILPLLARIMWKWLQIGTYMLLIITSTGDRLWDLSTSMTLNDLEPLKKRFLVNFSQFLDAAHISTQNCD